LLVAACAVAQPPGAAKPTGRDCQEGETPRPAQHIASFQEPRERTKL
jgi:hypothetical protein